MTKKFSNWRPLIFSIFLVLLALVPARAQQGQYMAHDVHVKHPSMTSSSGLATYSPIQAIDGQTIQLRGEDDIIYTFKIDANTVFCQGESKVTDWLYLKSVKRKASVTILTNDAEDTKALVIWDQAPTISVSHGTFQFSFPPMCR